MNKRKQNEQHAKHSQIAGKYATACRMAYAEGKPPPDWEEWKKLYNYGNITNIVQLPNSSHRSSTTQVIKNNARRQEKILKQLNITIENVALQFDILDDFFQELAERHPEYYTYHKLSDYIMGSICDIQEKIKTL